MKFTKMHGLGNDFILVEHLNLPDKDLFQFVKKLCHRSKGIGADGLVLLYPSSVADIRMRIINADGKEAEQCGNGYSNCP